MKTLTLLLLGVVILLPAQLVRADDDLKVDVVVNLTDAGKKIVRPDTAHPAYYYPISKGYTEGGQVEGLMGKPPPDWDVLHAIAKELYDQGYRMSTKAHQPDLVLVFWWGYKAPAVIDANGAASEGGGMVGGKGAASAAAITALSMSGELPTDTIANSHEMEELVMGSNYEADFSGSTTLRNEPSLRLERLINATHDPRFYVIISALDFSQALKKKFVVYWTARVSTPTYDHTLAEVIPTLLKDAAPSFGRDTDGPQITETPLIPEGRVIVGTPVVKSYNNPAANQKGSSGSPQP